MSTELLPYLAHLLREVLVLSAVRILLWENDH